MYICEKWLLSVIRYAFAYFFSILFFFLLPIQILPPWDTGKQSSISFKFRTNEPNGLILLTVGTKPGKVIVYYEQILCILSANINAYLCLMQCLYYNFSRIYLLSNYWMGIFTFMLILDRAHRRYVPHGDVLMMAPGTIWYCGVKRGSAKCQ